MASTSDHVPNTNLAPSHHRQQQALRQCCAHLQAAHVASTNALPPQHPAVHPASRGIRPSSVRQKSLLADGPAAASNRGPSGPAPAPGHPTRMHVGSTGPCIASVSLSDGVIHPRGSRGRTVDRSAIRQTVANPACPLFIAADRMRSMVVICDPKANVEQQPRGQSQPPSLPDQRIRSANPRRASSDRLPRTRLPQYPTGTTSGRPRLPIGKRSHQ